MVCNFDLPNDKDSYIHRYTSQRFVIFIADFFLSFHRIGRCGRFGRKGLAISLITRRDHQTIKTLEKYYGTQIDEMPQDFARHFV